MPILLIEVHLVQPLWHGAGDWPPSPFRLFQALVAGAYGGRWAGEGDDARKDRAAAFEWLERQNPPNIAFPPRNRVRRVTSFVPNNDLDSVGGDPTRVPDIRAEKTLSPWRIENDGIFFYAWTFDQGTELASLVCSLAQRLYCFGRGLDGAWARAEVHADVDVNRLLQGRGTVSCPGGQSQTGLRSPAPGSLDSLIRRHQAAAYRFRWDTVSRKFLFRQPPKPVYRTISYDAPGTRFYFDIREFTDLNRFYPIPQTKIVSLTEEARESAARRMVEAMPECQPLVERFLTGRSAASDDLTRRVCIIPLPSIGHKQTSPSIRRIAVLIPPDCLIPIPDLEWAFSGLPVFGFNKNTLTEAPAILVPITSPEMIEHYGFDRPARRWRSVTPVALPEPVLFANRGSQRAESEARSAYNLAQACRHAAISPRPTGIRIQEEPFLLRGELARAYAPGRFEGRLRHVEIVFEQPVRGPLLIGDGRFVGLGLMQPVFERSPGLHVFGVKTTQPLVVQNAAPVLRAFRRAVMARAQNVIGPSRPLPLLFHGHDPNGPPARGGSHAHLFFAAYSSSGGTQINRLAVIAPDFCDRNSKTARFWDILASAVDDLQVLVCGPKGEFRLAPTSSDSDSVFGLSRVWRSVTPYQTTRHPKHAQSTPDFIASDIKAECVRRALPIPQIVEVIDIQEGRRGSLSARLTLSFKAAVRGPLLLGRGSHFGIGLFTTV
jgi:CRISPR-associated protein Csb2